MKTYKFFYYDSYKGFQKNDVKTYVIYVSRFDLAFKSFVDYLDSLPTYIGYMTSYHVFNGMKTQCRTIPSTDLIYLSCLKDRHNARCKGYIYEN